MTSVASSLVCFAVKEEAGHFKKLIGGRRGIEVLLTGMGRRNAEKTVGTALDKGRPGRVITAGFAGGLIPELAKGTVIFCSDNEIGLEAVLREAGARHVRFHCAESVLTTVEQKRLLHETTGAEAVEMESQWIQSLCHERNIPVITVRVILDAANEGLTLDFNQFLTGDQRIDGRKLALALLKSPSKIWSLLRLQRESTAAARKLGDVLAKVLVEIEN